jgi:uncharacterized membrane protein
MDSVPASCFSVVVKLGLGIFLKATTPMISIRPLLMLLVLVSGFSFGCSKAEEKKAPTVTTEQKAATDKAHEDAKKANAPAK